MKTFRSLIDDVLPGIKEMFPWDLDEKTNNNEDILLIDITEPSEYANVHIKNSINVPRGILEAACEWDYEDTVPALANGRDKDIVIICRSGNRSDYELALYNAAELEVDEELADAYFSKGPREDQMKP